MAKENVGIKVKPPKNGGRRLVITDIHGCANTFIELLDEVGLTKEDQLFLLGDFINRGPRSKKVLDTVIQLKQDGFQVFPLIGNHEDNLLHKVEKSPNDLRRLLKSRNSTNLLNKKGNVRGRFLRLIRSLPYYYDLGDYYLVHAGFNLSKKKPFADSRSMAWMRNFQLKKPIDGRVVLFGHTPTKFSKIKKQVEENAPSICLDNGCSHTNLGKEYGRLVCLDLDTRELFRKKNVD